MVQLFFFQKQDQICHTERFTHLNKVFFIDKFLLCVVHVGVYSLSVMVMLRLILQQ